MITYYTRLIEQSLANQILVTFSNEFEIVQLNTHS